MAGFWAALPAGRVTRLVGADPAAITSTLEPLPDDAPATMICRPRVEASAARTVGGILDQLESAAVGLYPAWLPGAEEVDGPGGAGVAAVRTLALRKAATTPHAGPFLADLAERALRGRQRRTARFTAAVRAIGLARVVAEGFGRSQTALLVQVPGDLPPAGGQALLTACEWLAHHGRLAVWLTGSGLPYADRIPTVQVELTGAARAAGAAAAPPDPPALAHPAAPWTAPQTAALRLPVLAGRPHPASRAEQALEAALAAHPWAAGRVWNQTYQPDPLANPIRVDLMWPRERCAVEIDGPEHHRAQQYEADRRRDVQLQLAGFAVLRFTNTQIRYDINAVLVPLERLVTARRGGKD